jgi:hypothetical protein
MEKSYLQTLQEMGLDIGPLKNLVPLATRPLMCRRRFAASTNIAKGEEIDFFHVGFNDQATELGFASGLVNLSHTNLAKGGILPKGEVFVVHGVAFEFNHDVENDTVSNFDLCTVRWVEQAGTEGLPLGYVKNCPPVYTRRYQLNPSGTAEGAVYNSGKVFLSKSPLVILRGGAAESDQGALRMKSHQAFSVPTETIQTAWLLGTWFVKPRSGE